MGQVACMGNREVHTKLRSGKLVERNHLGDIGVDGNIILKLVLWNMVRRWRLDSVGSGSSPVVGFCENSNEPVGSLKSCGISRSAEYRVIKKGPTP
jgi:hypothetical protein